MRVRNYEQNIIVSLLLQTYIYPNIVYKFDLQIPPKLDFVLRSCTFNSSGHFTRSYLRKYTLQSGKYRKSYLLSRLT